MYHLAYTHDNLDGEVANMVRRRVCFLKQQNYAQ